MSDIEERMAPPAAVRRWAVWGGRGAASLADQAMFAGTHFVINVMLARWLPLEEYGLFAVAYSVMVFANAVHMALVAEPATVLWARHLERKGPFLGEVMALNLLVVLALSVAAAAGTALLAIVGTIRPLAVVLAVALAASLPAFWLVRQIAYADMKPWRAFLITAIYAVVLLGGSVALKSFDRLNGSSCLAVMSVAALVSTTWAARHYKLRPIWPASAKSRAVLKECWEYGRWSLPTGMFIWIVNNIFIVVLPMVTTLADVGRLKACMNLLMPIQQIFIGASLIALPTLSRSHAAGDHARARRMTTTFFLLAVLCGLLFSAAILVAGKFAYTFLYGPQHANDARLIMYGLALPTLWSAIAVARTDLRARQRPRAIFMAYASAIATVGLLAVALGAPYGPRGALLGLSAIQAAILSALILFMTTRPEAIRRSNANGTPDFDTLSQ